MKVVRSLSRNDSSISWFPHHNSIHLELPPNVMMVHINIFSQSGMTTFFASPEELMSNFMPWDPPRSPAGPVPNRPAEAPNPGFALSLTTHITCQIHVSILLRFLHPTLLL